MNDHTTIPTKRCTKCGNEFPATTDYFYKKADGKYGVQAKCKTCQSEHDHNYYTANVERIRERGRNYNTVNAERIRERNRDWRTTNAERIRAYRAANAERDRERSRTYRIENAKQVRESTRVWRAKNPEHDHTYRVVNAERRRELAHEYFQKPEIKVKMAVHSHNRRARKRSLRNDFTIAQRDFALAYWNSCCAYCGRQFFDLFGARRLAFDHFIPLASQNCPGSICTNLLPACDGVGGCNTSKGVTDPRDWLERRFGKRKAREVLARIEAYFEVVREFDAPTPP